MTGYGTNGGSANGRPARLVLADDHALVRVGLREVLEAGAAARSSGRPRTAPRPWTQAAVRAIQLGVVKPGSLSAG